nr:MAG: RNA-dependent RNA polymerase [brine shrimp chuvirus 2]UIW13714.1 MAG: RNA-dependent RNA polymerase [brine shrimp chuvirus 2]UIW13715.1 MAG: RNA-dependent RNA polymerase [brine shrimp chuvirus 2]
MYISQSRPGKVNTSISDWNVERKFDTALRKSTIEDLVYRFEKDELKRDDYVVKQWYANSRPTNYQCNTLYLPKIMYELLHKTNPAKSSRTNYRNITRNLYHYAKSNLDVQMNHMLQNYNILNKPLVLNSWNSFKKSINITPEIQILFGFQHELSRLINQLPLADNLDWRDLSHESRATAVNQINSWSSNILDLNVRFSSLYCKLDYGNISYLLPRPTLQQLHNKISDLLSVLIYASCAEHGELPSDTYKKTVRFVIELCTLHIQYEDKFFTIAKTIESFVIGEILREVDKDWPGGNAEFLNLLSANLNESIDFKYYGTLIEHIFKDVPIPLRNELGCLSKITGHPFVDMKEGTEALFKANNEGVNLNLKLIGDSVNTAKFNYVKQYVLKRRCWPPCEIETNAPDIVHDARRFNMMPDGSLISKRFRQTVNPDMMVYVDFLPDLRFDFLENFIPQLKDRTISALKTNVVQSILNVMSDPTKSNRIRNTDTRLLLYFITNVNETLNHKDYIDKYTYGELEELKEYLVVRIVPKEKELKPLYRGFGCCTYQERARRVVQEKNTKRFLAMYVPDQAMTTSELELARKLMGFRRLEEAYPGYKAIFTNIDSSKWNSKFRDETVKPIMKESLDPIFGYPIFSKTQEAYHHTFFYVPDGSEHYYYEGQLGGIEGLNQDSWVYIYLAQIHTAMKRYNERIPYFLLCKGDDLRVAILISPKLQQQISLSNIKNEIVNHLEETLKQFGHTIKPDDSYGSGKYFTFSKRATVETIGIPTAFRKIQKVYGANNALFPILDDFIASTFSNAHSSAREAVTFVSSYFVSLVWSYYYLINDKTIKDHQLTDDQLVSLLFIPSNLGGFPVIYLVNMPVRSESDHLPHFIHLTQFCERYYPQYAIYMLNFLHFNATKITHDSQLEGLFSDIYSLPVNKPSLPNSSLMKVLEKVLKEKCKNETINSIFLAKESDYTDKIVSILAKANVYDAKVFHNIYSALPRPMLKELLALFESSRSIREALLLGKSVRNVNRVFNKVITATISLLDWRIQTLKNSWIYRGSIVSTIYTRDKCPALIADQIREASWGKPVVNVTMPPMSHLLEYSTPGQIGNDVRAKRNNFSYKLIPPNKYLIGYPSMHFASGRTDPFVGYVTPTGTLAPTVNIIAKDLILQRVKNLIDLIPWCQVTELVDGISRPSNLSELIQKIVEDYTGMPLSDLSPFTQQKRGGTISHHVRARDFRESIMPNDINNRGQLIVGYADSHIECRLEAVKRRLNFLQILCHSTVILTLELDFSKTLTTPEYCSAITVDCDFCWSEVRDRALYVDLSNIPTVKPFGTGFLLAEGSLDILQESMGKFDKEALKPRDYQTALVPLRVATLTLMGELIDRTWEDKQAMAEMYSAHMGTAEAYNILRDVTSFSKMPVTRIGEIKCMPAEYMAEALLTYIYSYVVTREPFSKFTIFVSQQMIMATTPSALPWIDCIGEIYKAGRLSDLLVWAEKLSGLTPPMCYSYTGLSAQYIGTAACEAGRLGKFNITVCDYQYMTKANMIQKIRPYVDLVKYDLCVGICERLSNIAMSDLTLTQYYELCTIPYIISSDPLSEELVEDYIKNKIWGNVDAAEQIFEMSLIDGQMLDPTLVELPFPSICKVFPVLKQLSKTYPTLPWQSTWNTMHTDTGKVETVLTTIIDRQKLRIPIYITLIDQCVQSVRSNPSQLSKYSLLDMHTNLFPVVSRTTRLNVGISFRITETAGYDSSTELPSNLNRSQIPTLGDFRNKIDAAYWSKIFGRSNSAATKILSIVSGIIDLKATTEHISIACLGEGQGGVLGCLAELFPKSNFVYVSLPEGVHPTYLPDSALMSIDKTESKLLLEANQSLFYDLRDVATIEALKTYSINVSLYVCDAQTNKELEDLDILHVNIARYIFETYEKSFLAIIKMDVENTKSLVRLITIFKHLYGQTLLQFLCKPPGSQINRECYLVIWGQNLHTRSTFEAALTYSETYTYASILTNVKTFQENILLRNTTAKNIKLLNFVSTINPLLIDKNISFFIHSFLSRYLSELDAYIRHDMVKSRDSFAMILGQCLTVCLGQLSRQVEYLENPNKVATTSKAEFNLLIRKIHIARDLFVICGFYDTLLMIKNQIVEDKTDVSKVYVDLSSDKDNCLKRQFLRRLKKVCTYFDIQFEQCKKTVFSEKIVVGKGDNYTLSPYEEYITGIHGCMTFYQTLMIKRRISVYSGDKSLLRR